MRFPMRRQLLQLSLALALCLCSATLLTAQTTPPTQDNSTRPDKPVSESNGDSAKSEASIAPFIEKARVSLPGVKKRYLQGLPAGQILYVTIRLNDSQGRFEQAFVKVNSWSGTIIKGTLSTDMDLIKKFKKGDALTCRDSQIMDWTISKPDGSEEGNFVGKFLNPYKPN